MPLDSDQRETAHSAEQYSNNNRKPEIIHATTSYHGHAAIEPVSQLAGIKPQLNSIKWDRSIVNSRVDTSGGCES